MPFKKGNSGRPKGATNYTTRQMRETASPYAMMGLRQLADIAAGIERTTENGRPKETRIQIAASDKINAIKELLDRAFGKVKQGVNVNGTIGAYDLDRLPTERLQDLRSLLIEASPSNTVGPPAD